MKRLTSILLACMLLILVVGSANAAAQTAGAVATIPTFTVISVVPDTSVSIQTYNFPAQDTFTVLMGKMGTRGVKGIQVASVSSGAGGSFKATYNIPDALKGSKQIAIRLESSTGSGYFAYNWFYNKSGGSGTGSGTGTGTGTVVIPTFSITSVVADTNVTISTKNFPANDNFDVLMGNMGTQGVNGVKVATFDSGAGGTLSATFNIPDSLKGKRQIAIRLQSNTGSGYFAYNWFYNNTTGSGTGGGDGTGGPSYTGFPSFSIASVVRNQTVTVVTNNLPQNDTFNVRMGPMGTRGVNGYLVTTINSGSGGTQTLTFNIPAELSGSNKIAIRMESPTSGYFAYNWFYNNTAN